MQGRNASRGTFLRQKRGTGNEATPKLGRFWSFPTSFTLPSFTFTLSGMQILGGEAQLFGGEVEHFGGEASPALPPLDETLPAPD